MKFKSEDFKNRVKGLSVMANDEIAEIANAKLDQWLTEESPKSASEARRLTVMLRAKVKELLAEIEELGDNNEDET